MAYVVLALGVLMAAAGVDAIATGYPVIQVERGWATVISGSVMLTGGLVTVALGLAIRTLADIRSALRSQPGLAPAAAAVSPPIGSPQVMPRPTPAEPLPAHDIVPALGSAAAATTALKAAEPLAHEARDPLQSDPPQEESPPPAPDPFEAPSLPSVEPALRSPEPAHQAPDPAKTDEPTPDGYELQSPSTAEHDIARAEPLHAPRPTEEEDWLDRALSDFEAGLSPTHPAEVLAPEHVSNAAEDAAAIQAEVPAIRPEPAAAAPEEAESTLIEPAYAEEAHAEPVQAGPVQAGPSPAEPAQSATEPQAAPAHEPAPHDLAVIGRYESDGTSYVMYADGSIEAQSDAGVYRFRSMAELKAFIEG